MFNKIESIKSSDEFFSKGYSRIFILEKDKRSVDLVLSILKDFDQEEWESKFYLYRFSNRNTYKT